MRSSRPGGGLLHVVLELENLDGEGAPVPLVLGWGTASARQTRWPFLGGDEVDVNPQQQKVTVVII